MIIETVDLAFHRLQGAQHALGILVHDGVIEFVSEMFERASKIADGDIEDLLGAGGIAADLQCAVEENRRDIHRRHQVLQVAIGAADLFDLFLIFLVYRRQLFVN